MSATIAMSSASIMSLSHRFCTTTYSRLPAATRPLRRLAYSPNAVRPFTDSARLTYPRKDSQDKDSINTEATEYSKSATDDESARQEDAAFDPDITDPQDEKDLAGKHQKDGNNPLEVSPANPEVSKSRGNEEGGPGNSSASSDTSSERQRSSGGGSPSKGSEVA